MTDAGSMGGIGAFSWRVKATFAVYVLGTVVGTIAVGVGFTSEMSTLWSLGAFDESRALPPAATPDTTPAASTPSYPVPSAPVAVAPPTVPATPPVPEPAPASPELAAMIARSGYEATSVSPGSDELVGSFVAAYAGESYGVSAYDFTRFASDEGYVHRVGSHIAVNVSAYGEAGGDTAEATRIAERLVSASPHDAAGILRALGGGLHITDPPVDEPDEDSSALRYFGVGAEHGTTSISITIYDWSRVGTRGNPSGSERRGDRLWVVDAWAWSGATATMAQTIASRVAGGAE